MKRLPIFFITPFLLLLVLGATLYHTPHAALAQSSSYRLRIGVVQDGIVRITPEDLQNAGVDATTIDPRTFALSSQGQPVAIRVAGEDDGSFDAGDFIEFFGQKFHSSLQDEKYTDENVYWLEIGGDAGPRILDINAQPDHTLTPPTDFSTTVHIEQNKYWYTQHRMNPPTKESWYWDILRPVGAGAAITRTYPGEIPFPIAGHPFSLTVEENARAQNINVNPDHHTVIGLNGQILVDETWDGKRRQVFTATIPADLLTSGRNTLSLTAINPPGVTADYMYFNYWEVTYRRAFTAWQGQIDFQVEEEGPHEYQIGGWTSSQITIFDISDPAMPRRLTLFEASASGSEWMIRFRSDDQAGDRLWLQEEASILSPASIVLRPSMPELRHPDAGVDVIIITGPELQASAQRLALWHQQRGFSSRIVFFQDLVDEFDDGIYHPRAITNFLNWTQSNWPAPKPGYVVLFGDGHWNFKGYNTAKYPMEPNIVPPYLAWVDPWQGEVPDDNRYADLDGDGDPELSLGRIPVNTPAEADAVVDKIVSYDENRRSEYWQRQAIFIADYDPSVGDLAGESDRVIADYLPDDLIPHRIYLNITHPDTDAVRQAIADAINQGAWMLQYAGHGSPSTWMKGQGWTLEDVESLHNVGRYPFVSTFNCLDGYFVYPGYPSMAETMLRKSKAGSIAAISPTGLGTTDVQTLFRRTLMDVIFHEDVRRLGDALLLTKQRFYEDFGFHYLIETMTLFGDPTLQLPEEQYQYRTYTPLYLNPNPLPLTPTQKLPPRRPTETDPLLTPPL